MLFADLRAGDGSALAGIPLADISLTDRVGTPVPGVVGPVFFGATGDVDSSITVSTAFAGRARVAILDCPAGSYTLRVVTPGTTFQVPVTFGADGATLASTGG